MAKQEFMMHDVRFPFYMTDSGKFVVYKGKVYQYHFVDYMNWKDANGMPALSPDTLAAYLEQLEPTNREFGKLVQEAEKYAAEQEEQRKREERRAYLVKTYRADYENACDDLYYGYGFKFWYTHYGVNERLSEEDAKTLWRAAVLKMSNAA
jgi:hypothetical protein